MHAFSPTDNILIVAEAGVNHNGSLELAHRLEEEAARAGADIIKFQTFRAADLVAATAPRADYQIANTGTAESQREMLARLELGPEAFSALKAQCDALGIRFWSTAFDLASIDLLRALAPGLWKIPSGEITNLPYLRKIGEFGEEVVLSTGMADLGEIEAALTVLEGAGTARENITLLHCTTEYPAPLAGVNLRAMGTLRSAFPGIAGVGYSDHTDGIEIALAAAAMGATLIEKHFTLDRALPGPDHKASLEPAQLRSMVRGVRNILTAMGDGVKRPTPEERKNRLVARKSLVASRPIKKGDILDARNMTVKRPGSGISPMRWDEVCGQRAQRDYAPDEVL